MSTFVLTGTFTPEHAATESSARQICAYLATFLRQRQYDAYEVWSGFRARDSAWRLLVALPGPVKHMPDLTVLNEVQDLFRGYVVRESFQTRWVDKLEDPYCWDVDGWVDWGREKKKMQKGGGDDNKNGKEKEKEKYKHKGSAGSSSAKMESVTILSCDRILGETF
ncbi:hypothetical protein BJY01DRAFT_245346 [Aspergillus pseudoustus]|uniref:Uncharacterized protein n=1 Tax=Aspergillus pseudoustus TaxID=1810923 RepID=A0ABR4KHH5_9EURO